MPAYLIVDMTPKDLQALKQYSESAAKTLNAHQGEFLAKGEVSALHGKPEFAAKAIIVFPNKELAQAWYQSSDYQALIPQRELAMDSRFTLLG